MTKQDRAAALALIFAGVLVGMTGLSHFFRGARHYQSRVQEITWQQLAWHQDRLPRRTAHVRPSQKQRTQHVGHGRVGVGGHAMGGKRAAVRRTGTHRPVVAKWRAPRHTHATQVKRTAGLRVHRYPVIGARHGHVHLRVLLHRSYNAHGIQRHTVKRKHHDVKQTMVARANATRSPYRRSARRTRLRQPILQRVRLVVVRHHGSRVRSLRHSKRSVAPFTKVHAAKKGHAMATPEGKVKAKINHALKTLPRCYKFMPVQSGLGAKSLDYLLCVNGRFVAIEAKAPGKDYTALQREHKRHIEEAGGVVFLVDGEWSLAGTMRMLESY